MMTRTTGYIGHTIDHVALTNQVQLLLKATYGDADFGVIDPMPLLMVELVEKDGWGDTKYGFINTEGVGAIANDYNKIELWVNTNGYGVMIPIELGSKLLASMVTGEQQDLAEWVRSFGARLDGNVRLWQGKMAQPKELASK